MLFMPIMAAAPLAASSASGVRWVGASSRAAVINSWLREVMAEATTVPHACCWFKSVCWRTTLEKLSFRSLAYGGIDSINSSRFMDLTFGVTTEREGSARASGARETYLYLKSLLPFLPVAGAELVGLKRVENTQH